ncbi:MAG TPA: TA system VapC family ribonuclease toxin [Candidatus Binatia bacterium]|nr:TA system VapC family ribonuclease toxin [Candidatus Binatia bacterium]
MPDLLDVSVWLPLSVPDHVHHERARQYWDREAADEVMFCRVTALAFLRLVTNPRVLRDRALHGATAWNALRTWLATPGVGWLDEPPALDEWLARWASDLDLSGAGWTDAYLAAFAAASGCRLVAFDADFLRYPGVDVLHLRPSG